MGTIDCILLLLAVNLAMFGRTMKFSYANDCWELAKCACKIPKVVDARDGVGAVIRVCEVCGIKERIVYKNWFHFIYYHYMGQGYSNPLLAHSMTLAVHIINTTLIYLAFGGNTISFCTALLFAIHPVATQGSSVWLSGRNYGTATMLTLLMKCIPIATPLIYILMFRFALIGAPAPAIFVNTGWWFWILLIPIMVLIMKKTVRQSTEFKYRMVSMTRQPFSWNNVILFFKTIGYYFCLCLVPTHLGIHHTYLERYGLTKEETKYALKLDGFLILGVFLCILQTIAFFFFWGNPIVYGLTWFFIFMIPWSNICTIHQAVAERYIVLSLVGLMYAFVNVLGILPYPYEIVILGAFVGFYACRTQIYIKIYRDVLTCSRENTNNFEDSAAAWRWRGGLERNLGLLNESFASWMEAWRLRPYDFVLNNNIAAILAQQGRLDEAQKFMDMANKCPMPTPDLKAKWDKRMAEFQAALNLDKQRRASRMNIARNQKCPECAKKGIDIKFKRCEHGGN